MSKFAALSFDQCVQALPPELYDEIFTLALPKAPTPAANTTIITPSYKPPICLHIDRALRNTFATPFYNTSTFKIGPTSNTRLARKWLKSLPTKHLVMLRHVHVGIRIATFGPTQLWNQYMRALTLLRAVQSAVSVEFFDPTGAKTVLVPLTSNPQEARRVIWEFAYGA